jgi:periodic tryptophan protein 1
LTTSHTHTVAVDILQDEFSDKEDLIIRPDDLIVLSAVHEDDINRLEVNIFDEGAASMYLHHDLVLNDFPLCVTWLNFCAGESGTPPTAPPLPPSREGNFAAVATMSPAIEIWNLDVLDVVEPTAILGGFENHPPPTEGAWNWEGGG